MKEVAGSGADLIISGVTLAQYAAVTAALAEAFPLRAVLATEGIDRARWAEADRGWTERLAEDGALLARYQAELAAAQDRLARTVEPIDTDLGAWLAFLAALARTPDLLEQHGIGPDDVARLERRWNARMKEDPTLEKRAAELRNQGAGKLPPLRVVKGKLTRSGAALPPPPAASRPAAPPPAPPAPVAAAEPPRPAPAPPPEPERSEEKTRLGAIEVPGGPLPFGVEPSRQFLDALDRRGAEPGEGSDGWTMPIRRRPAPADAPAPAPPVPLSATVTGVTSPFATNPVPFRPPDKPAAPAPDDDEPPPSSAPSPGRTVKMRLPRRPAAPPAAAPPPDDTDPDEPPDEPTQIMRGKDAPVGTTVTGVISPFAQEALPFNKKRAPPPGPPPSLSLEQHACLCLELAIDPARAADTLARYQVSAADKERADEWYRARSEADPDLRAQWNRAFERYRAWFMSRQ